jgi:hypothetical protein
MNWSLKRRWLRWGRLGVVGAVMVVGLMVSLSTSPPRPVRVIAGAVEDLECSLAQQSQSANTYTQVLVVPGPGGVTTVTLPVGGGRSGVLTASGDLPAVARTLEGVGWSCWMAS